MRELPTIAPHEGLWVLYALRAAFTRRRDPRRRTRSRISRATVYRYLTEDGAAKNLRSRSPCSTPIKPPLA
jgi:hypothetical protein